MAERLEKVASRRAMLDSLALCAVELLTERNGTRTAEAKMDPPIRHPRRAAIAEKAGVSTKTIQRLAPAAPPENLLDGMHQVLEALTDSQMNSFFDFLELDIPPNVNPSVAVGLGISAIRLAPIPSLLGSPEMGQSWCRKFEALQHALPEDLDVGSWSQAVHEVEDQASFTLGKTAGLAASLSAAPGVDHGTTYPIPDYQSSPNQWAELLTRLELSGWTGWNSSQVTGKRGAVAEHPSARAARLGYLAGLLGTGDFSSAMAYTESVDAELEQSPACYLADMICSVGAGLLSFAPAEREYQRAAAAEVLRAILDHSKPDKVAHADEATRARLQVWPAWIRGDLRLVVRNSPLISGQDSIWTARQNGSPWTVTPDLIPPLHDASEQLSYDDLAQYLQFSAHEFLRDPTNATGFYLTRPREVPFGQLVRLLSLAGSFQLDGFQWSHINSPTIQGDVILGDRFRIAVALGYEPDDNLLRDLHALLVRSPAPRQAVVTRHLTR